MNKLMDLDQLIDPTELEPVAAVPTVKTATILAVLPVEIEYAVRLLELLNHKTPTAMSSISSISGIPCSILHRINTKLRKAGLVVAKHGPNGGTIRTNGQITLGCLYNAINVPGRPGNTASPAIIRALQSIQNIVLFDVT